MRTLHASAWPSLLVLLAACGGTTPEPEPKSTCDLSTASLDGKSFVELEIQSDKSEEEDPMARVQFRTEAGTTKALYTMKNGLHTYEYTCASTAREGELKCVTAPQLERACLAFEVHEEGSCTAEKLEAAELGGPAAEVTAAIEATKKLVAEARVSPQWPQFKLIHNNLGNPLQGQLFVKVDKERCRIMLDDMYVTVFNGKRIEDYNPVGTNAFVRTEGEYLFDDCDREGVLADLDVAELPADLSTIPSVRQHATGKPVHYHYVGDASTKAEEGCTYSVDGWANWEPAAKDQPATVGEDGTIAWTAAHTWTPGDLKTIGADRSGLIEGGFFHLTRYKTCAGTKEKIDTVCNAGRVALETVAEGE